MGSEVEIAYRLVFDELALIEHANLATVQLVAFHIHQHILPVVGHSFVSVFKSHHKHKLYAHQTLNHHLPNHLPRLVDCHNMLITEQEIDS